MGDTVRRRKGFTPRHKDAKMQRRKEKNGVVLARQERQSMGLLAVILLLLGVFASLRLGVIRFFCSVSVSVTSDTRY